MQMEKRAKEQQVFRSGKNWRPEVTTPVTPKLSCLRDDVPSLKKLSPEPKKSLIKSNPAPKPAKSKSPGLGEEELISLEDCNNFDDAVSLIHSHIQMLEV